MSREFFIEIDQSDGVTMLVRFSSINAVFVYDDSVEIALNGSDGHIFIEDKGARKNFMRAFDEFTAIRLAGDGYVIHDVVDKSALLRSERKDVLGQQ